MSRTDVVATPPTDAVTVHMSRYAFEPSTFAARAGTVKLFLVNRDELPRPGAQSFETTDRTHTLALVGANGLTIAVSDRIGPQASALFTVESVPPGTYRFNCTIGTHASRGMVGTLDITA